MYKKKNLSLNEETKTKKQNQNLRAFSSWMRQTILVYEMLKVAGICSYEVQQGSMELCMYENLHFSCSSKTCLWCGMPAYLDFGVYYIATSRHQRYVYDQENQSINITTLTFNDELNKVTTNSSRIGHSKIKL